MGLDYWVKCDRCDRKITCNGAVTEQEARLEARDRGWVKGFNHAHIRDWCPDCGKGETKCGGCGASSVGVGGEPA